MVKNINHSLERISGEGEESDEKRKAASAAETGAGAGNLSEDELASVAGGIWIPVPDSRLPSDQLDEAEIPDGVVGRRFPMHSVIFDVVVGIIYIFAICFMGRKWGWFNRIIRDDVAIHNEKKQKRKEQRKS